MIFFNRKAWWEFERMLSHRHTFTSDNGYLPIGGHGGAATFLRCKCGQGQWFFR